MYNTQTLNFNNGGLNSKGILTISNFSNSDYNQVGDKSSTFLKWYDSKYSSKTKRGNEGTSKIAAISEVANYSTKRPKSAKGVGMYINTSKYKQSDNYASNKYK